MKDILKIFTIFTPKQIHECYFIALAMIIGAILESLGIGAILPLISLMGQPDFLEKNLEIAEVAGRFGVTNHIDLIIVSSITLIGVYLIKNIYIAWEMKLQRNFARKNQIYYSAGLLETYFEKPYSFHVMHNTATLLRNVNSGATVIFSSLLVPVFMLFTEIFTAVSIWIMLILVDPFTAIVVAGIMAILICVIIKSFQRIITRCGEVQNKAAANYIKWINQGLGAIKETKVMRKENFFLQEFKTHYKNFADSINLYYWIADMPRLIIEALVVSGILLLIVVKIKMGQNPMDIVPMLGLLALAAFRLMPSANRIVGFYNAIRNQLPFFNEIYDDLIIIRQRKLENKHFLLDITEKKLSFNKQIDISDLKFTYPNETKKVLADVSFSIPKGKFVGIVGSSGAGKTTFVDIMLGLLEPQKGQILCDGQDIYTDIRAWQANLAYVPQDIYLIDGTVRDNIALGVLEEDIDDRQIEKVLHMAELYDFVQTLPKGLDTFVGERGVKLSGGQRQRIGIARALYQNPNILILDEATSALDNETEKSITDTILKLKGQITIIAIAHRVSTLEQCDFKVKFEDGRAAVVND